LGYNSQHQALIGLFAILQQVNQQNGSDGAAEFKKYPD
jgi:hypothetical protein